MNHKSKAFTLLETMITLTISCALLFIGSLQVEKYQAELSLLNTTREVRAAFEHAARMCTIKKTTVLINYSEARSVITFRGTLNNNYERELKVDKKIKIHNLYNVSISTKGIINPRTITLTNGQQMQKIKVQMTWGRAIVE